MKKGTGEGKYEKNTPTITYENRYKHKLNMLEPGTVMLKWIGIFLAVGLTLLLLHMKIAAYIMFGVAGATFLFLLILLAIEAHQDNVLNEIAAQEMHSDRLPKK